MSQTLNFVKMFPDVSIPYKASSKSVGFDLESYQNIVIPCNGISIINTGLKVQPPRGTYIRLASRSGLACKGISVQGGVIDPDYTGEVKVILYNHTSEPFEVIKGMRIAQMIPEKAAFPRLNEREGHFKITSRCENGFGSTGI